MQEPSREPSSSHFNSGIHLEQREVETYRNMPKKDHFWRTISIFIVFVLLLRLFVIDPFLVHGSSMEPTFDEGDYVIVDKITYTLSEPIRGDVIVFDAPTEDGRYFIKRIVGLPGERVEVNGSTVKIYNSANPNGITISEPYVVFKSGRVKDLTLGSDEYFVMGDNREVSSDSRIWGPLKKSAITGRALIRLLPLKQAGILPGFSNSFTGVVYPENIGK